MRDYSSYIVVENNLDVHLSLDSQSVIRGKWTKDSQSRIAAKSTTKEMQVKNTRDSNGSASTLNYTIPIPSTKKTHQLAISFSCSPSSNNEINASTTCPALFGVSATTTSETPLKLKISLTYTFIKTTCEVTKVVLRNPSTPIKNTKSTTTFGENMEIWSHTQALATQDNSTYGVAGSYIPAAVSHQSFLLDVYISADEGIADVPFLLTGELNGDVVIQVDQVYQNTSIRCNFQSYSLTLPWGYAGDIAFHLVFPPTDQKLHLNSCRIEIYCISPSLPPFFQTGGIPVEFLRHFVLRRPRSEGEEYAAWIARHCMTGFDHQFDTVFGAPSFVTSSFGGSFKLKYWLESVKPSSSINPIKINCYDQAALVQLALSLQHGTPSKPWALMQPFGYIKPTTLVGWPIGCEGQCNNPFFRERQSRMLLPADDRERMGFYNHAFCVVGGKVVDACCGPHEGSEDVGEYIEGAVDRDTSLYNGNLRPGTVDDILYCDGVTSLDSGPEIADIDSATRLSSDANAALDQIMTEAMIPDSPPPQSSATNIQDIKTAIYTLGAHLTHHSTDIGPLGSEIRFIFTINSTTYTLTLYICTDHDTAVGVMRQHLSCYQAPPDTVFSRPDEGYRKGQLNLEGNGRSIWIRDNIFFILSGDAIGHDISIAAAFDNAFSTSDYTAS